MFKPMPSPTQADLDASRQSEALFRMIVGFSFSQVIRTACELRVFDHLAEGPRTAAEVAKRTNSNAKAALRLLRACAALELVRRDQEDRFSLEPLGELLREDVPGSLRDFAIMMSSPGTWLPFGRLPDAVRSGKAQVLEALGSDSGAYYAEHPGEAEHFARAMSNMGGLVATEVTAMLDLPEAATIVDVGGAEGGLLLALLKDHPAAKGVVFDLPANADIARRAIAAAGESGRCTVVSGDFFDSVPAGDYFLLKNVLHDWPDGDAARILRSCRSACRPGARALVVETLIGAQFGPGADLSPLSDMVMLVITGGEERDLPAFDALFGATGWRRVALSPTRSPYALIEMEAV